MNKPMITLMVLLVSACSYASLDIENGVGIYASNKNELWNVSIPYSVARQGLRSVADNEYIVAFQDLGDYVFGLSNAPRLLKVQVSDRVLLGSWPLTRWRGEYLEEEVLSRYAGYAIDYHDAPFYVIPRESGRLGCLNNAPLRYGIFSATDPAVVLILADNLAIFDVSEGKVVFSLSLSVNDWLDSESTLDLFTDEEGILHAREESPRNASRIALNASDQRATLSPDILPGYRGYAKLYSQDFDEDGQTDLVVWRKLYVSRLLSDPVGGFKHIKSTFIHYKHENGEYTMQETPESTVQGWLATNNLTWQKGFPSKSECPGEEGQLIPEMHDHLLNDPDVLR